MDFVSLSIFELELLIVHFSRYKGWLVIEPLVYLLLDLFCLVDLFLLHWFLNVSEKVVPTDDWPCCQISFDFHRLFKLWDDPALPWRNLSTQILVLYVDSTTHTVPFVWFLQPYALPTTKLLAVLLVTLEDGRMSVLLVAALFTAVDIDLFISGLINTHIKN